MKHFLLTFLSAAAIVCSASAQDATLQTVHGTDFVKVKTVKSQAPVKKIHLAPGVTVTESHRLKKLHNTQADSKVRIPRQRKARVNASSDTDNGYIFFESFENWNGTDYEWIPDGWTVDMRGDVTRESSWTPSAASLWYPGPSDGDFYYGISYSTDHQDEWLISPTVQIGEGMTLSFYLYLDPVFLFNLDDIDWDKYEFIGEKTVAATLQIWAQAEGEDWIMLHDYFDDYSEYSLLDLYRLAPTELEKKTIDISQFEGKKAKVAFRYVGADGNSMLIDAIGIGYPSLDGISYMEPFSTLYWGLDGTAELTGLQAAIAQQPVYEPLTWINMSEEANAVYQWTYCDPVTADFVTSDEQYELTETYIPDYSSEASMRNNFFYPPTLTATAPKATPGSYTSPYLYFQAGGKAERTLNDGSDIELDLMPFPLQTLGLEYITVDDSQIGDFALPVFGYNVNSDQYWLNYSLNDSEANEGDFSHLEGIANLILPYSSPLVVSGVNVYGFGKIGPDAKLTATIYGLDADMSTDISSMEVIATATINGSDVLSYDGPSSISYLSIPFDFDTPAVIKATEEHPAYFVIFQGFRSEAVEYFAPLQSSAPDPNYMCLGYILNHIDLSSHTGRDAYWNIKQMVYKENGEYVDLYSAFAIGLKGEYPWLTSDYNDIIISDNISSVQIPMGSYYDGSKLTVEAPDGITASAAGRYDSCILSVEHSDRSKDVDGTITVKGPGVELSFTVKAAASSGIADIVADGRRTVSGIYDLCGRRVENTAKTGVYIIRYTDGSSEKSIIK